jgi:fumarylacetoacetase
MPTSSWIPVPADSDFSILNLPFGVFSFQNAPSSTRHVATIVGDTVIDLTLLEEARLFADFLTPNTLAPPLNSGRIGAMTMTTTLNKLLEHPKPVWTKLRQRLLTLLVSPVADARLRDNVALQKAAFHDVKTVTMHLPISIGDYTDFYSSREHATNVGTMFRGAANALQPNWLHLPVGYHGRASTVFVSGHESSNFHRPCGQLQKDSNDESQGSIHAPCRLLDFELEMAAVVGGTTTTMAGHHHGHGHGPLNVQQAKDCIFGFVLMNDWSARDLQKWEYVPLGPFTAKNFCTTISPWIVTCDALQPYMAPTSAVVQDNPMPLEYLRDDAYGSYDIDLTVAIQSQQQSTPHVVCRSNFKNLYWNAAQQLAHHTVSGCIMKPGDLLGSGTISGSDASSFGSMLELSWKGSRLVQVGDETRKFLEDGDTVIMTGVCGGSNSSTSEGGTSHGRVGFGECRATILPAVMPTTTTTATSTSTVAEPAMETKRKDRYQDFVLYSYWRSSASWRVRATLAAKSIEYQTIPINLLKGEQHDASYLEKNPLGQVPTLEFTDAETNQTIRMSQSIAIVEFLEEVFPDRQSVLPRDPLQRALARQMVEIINSGTQPLQNIFRLKDYEARSDGKIKASEEAKAVNERGLKSLEALVVQQHQQNEGAGPYCTGSFCITIADFCLVAQVYNARRFGVDLAMICPTLVQINALCEQDPCIQASRPEAQPDAVPE